MLLSYAIWGAEAAAQATTAVAAAAVGAARVMAADRDRLVTGMADGWGRSKQGPEEVGAAAAEDSGFIRVQSSATKCPSLRPHTCAVFMIFSVR